MLPNFFIGTRLDRICSPGVDTKECFAEVDFTMTAREFQSLKIINESSLDIKACNCLPTCTAISYDFEIAQASMNWKQYVDGVERGTNRYFDK